MVSQLGNSLREIHHDVYFGQRNVYGFKHLTILLIEMKRLAFPLPPDFAKWAREKNYTKDSVDIYLNSRTTNLKYLITDLATNQTNI